MSEDDWSALPEDICLSGGAEGADLQFGMVAGSCGHRVFHFIFDGHRSKAPEAEKVVLKAEQLSIADPYLVKANKTLRRKWPVSNPFTANLLRRNYYQVCEASAVYAVSELDDDGLVKGGTSWACQMFIDRFPPGDDLPIYVFDQSLSQWFSWQVGAWEAIDQPPRPSGVWAGIGSRKLNDAGKNAIRNLFDFVPSNK